MEKFGQSLQFPFFPSNTVTKMGQSDTESTSSSMRGNPGSPRDISVLFDEPSGDLAAALNTAFTTPNTSSNNTELDSSVVAIETPKRNSTGIPVIDLTSPDGAELAAATSQQRSTTNLPE